MGGVRPNTLESIRARLVPEGDCLVWSGSKDAGGYGKVRYQGRSHRVHRIIFEAAYGPTELLVCHRCDNPPCARLDHLFAGTYADNAHDAIAKGRMPPHGEVGEWQRAKTHCPAGHPYDEVNTAVAVYIKKGKPTTTRRCRACSRAR